MHAYYLTEFLDFKIRESKFDRKRKTMEGDSGEVPDERVIRKILHPSTSFTIPTKESVVN
jgi:hypothetical protein